MFFIYIIFSVSSDKFYVGMSADPWNRVVQHNNNNPAKFTGKANDWKLVAVFNAGNSKSFALKIERFIKNQKSRKLILNLINPDTQLKGTLSELVRVPHVRD